MNEKKIISLAQKYFKNNKNNLIKSIGDDTAVYKASGKYQLFTSDMLIDKTHFILEKIPAYKLGWKALAVNISDIASMGGIPDFALLSLAINRKITYSWLEDFYNGLSDCANTYNVNIIGGDTVSSKSDLVINIALTGNAKKPIYRNKVKEDYILTNTGYLGLSALGLYFILNNIDIGTKESFFIEKHYKPIPKVEEGLFLANKIKTLSMLDASDSLYTSIKIMCEQNKLGFELNKNNNLISKELKEYCTKNNLNPFEFIIFGGEDYELIMAMSENDFYNLKSLYLEKFNFELPIIGKFTNKHKKILEICDNNIIELKDNSFTHF
ncbi:MAG: thiamine-phosphate kinase [Candidatus Sericytochromatia bacterium]